MIKFKDTHNRISFGPFGKKKKEEKKADGNDEKYLQGNLPIPAAYEYYKGLSKRIISIDSEIDSELDSLRPVKQIIRWNIEDMGKLKEEREPIYILFHSYGGDADICTAIIDAIQTSTTPIVGINLGVAYSAAAYIFISCPTRYMFERASLLFHQGSAEFSGTFDVIMAAMEQYQAKVGKLSDIIKKFTKFPEEEIEESITGEWYIYAEEAIEKGAADYIIRNIEDVFSK
jgi:ATP-dependent protease ClpP protease subunit